VLWFSRGTAATCFTSAAKRFTIDDSDLAAGSPRHIQGVAIGKTLIRRLKAQLEAVLQNDEPDLLDSPDLRLWRRRPWILKHFRPHLGLALPPPSRIWSMRPATR